MLQTKKVIREKEFIVIRHKLRDFDDFINGIRFRRGYAVVDKTSKAYTQIKKLPFLKNALEFPLLHLKNLKFIINDRQIDFIYGREVYNTFLRLKKIDEEIKEIEYKQEEEVAHLEKNELCKYVTNKGTFCKFDLDSKSPSGYCLFHILKDPKIEEETGVKIPKMMSKKELKEVRKKVMEKLNKKAK